MQRTLITLILAWILGACGHETDKGSTAPAPVGVVATEAPAPLQSIALNTLSALPACTDANETQLAYVVEVGVFYACQAGRWVEIDVKGADGADGKDGANGKDGAPAPAPAANQWVDPFTGRVWVGGGWGPSTVGCPTKHRLPTVDEAYEAVEHGLFTSTDKVTDLWVEGGAVIGVNHGYVSPAGMHGLICIKL